MSRFLWCFSGPDYNVNIAIATDPDSAIIMIVVVVVVVVVYGLPTQKRLN